MRAHLQFGAERHTKRALINSSLVIVILLVIIIDYDDEQDYDYEIFININASGVFPWDLHQNADAPVPC